MYISVSDAAIKFNLSKRRIQILCEQGRINGATMISGVWLIPEDAQKPTDARIKKTSTKNELVIIEDNKKQLSLQEVCNILSISTATAKNWIRLGKLISEDNGTLFNKQYIINLSQQMKLGNDPRLKSRRNKKNVTGKILYKDYINNIHNQNIIENILSLNKNITEQDLRIILANFAIQLYYQSYELKKFDSNILLNLVNSSTINETFYSLIIDLLGTTIIEKNSLENLHEFLNYNLIFIPTEDTLGFIYISLRDLSQRKSSGAYYTPMKTVTTLLENIFEHTDISTKTFFDPCCGTGNFLIGLINKGISISNIYAQDIDEISIQLARITIFLLCHKLTKNDIYSHLICDNTLKNTFPNKFDIILGNPPWGFEFQKEEIDYLLSYYSTAKPKGTESFDLFIEKAISMLKTNGIMAFILPESILSVASHIEVRKLIIENCSFNFISFLGNVFSGVQCPAIILGITLNYLHNTIGCKVNTEKDTFIIKQQRTFGNFILSFNMSDDEHECLNAIATIENAVYLHDNAKFALGIVTGNNKEYITTEKYVGYEVILKGSDIQRYKINPSNNFIQFIPEHFQQVAPTEMYRSPEKLLYRFISEVPVFAYDNSQTLSLNSCNILIPQIEGLNMKYILAILNSSVATYYISKKFNSVKLLRSHLEQLPIPMIDLSKQMEIIKKVDCIINSEENINSLYQELDEEIMELYNLNPQFKKTIKNSLSNKNLFLP